LLAMSNLPRILNKARAKVAGEGFTDNERRSPQTLVPSGPSTTSRPR
jgi:hypothetical protein